MGYIKPRPMNLLHRKCIECGCDLYLDKKETYVIREKSFIEKVFSQKAKILCIPCDREIRINSIIK